MDLLLIVSKLRSVGGKKFLKIAKVDIEIRWAGSYPCPVIGQCPIISQCPIIGQCQIELWLRCRFQTDEDVVVEVVVSGFI